MLLASTAVEYVPDNFEARVIISIIESLKNDIVFYGSLETLENAIKGGRINPIAGKLINALNFKVIFWCICTHNSSYLWYHNTFKIILIVKAAQLAEEGKGLDEIVSIIESLKKVLDL